MPQSVRMKSCALSVAAKCVSLLFFASSSGLISTADAEDMKNLTVCVGGPDKKLSLNGKCDPGYVPRLYTLSETKPASQSKPTVKPAAKPLGPIVAANAGNTSPIIPSPIDSAKGCHNGWNTHLTIGDSFNDLNFLSTKDCAAAGAKGAQFSWARDGIAFNDQWTAKGAVAERFVWLNEPESKPTAPYLNLLAVAPVFTFQRVTNSNLTLASKNVDTLAYGFSSEALFDRVAKDWQVYLRARATANGDFEGHTHSWSATGEVQPLNRIFEHITIPSVGYLILQPLIRAQYFERVGPANPTTYKNDPIFNLGANVVRAGPVISATIIPQPLENTDPNKPPPQPQWSFNITYSWYSDLVRRQTFEHFNPSFTYNFTDNIGLTLSYERGKVEQTGNKIDLASIGLSIKN
jgi:hypothetical protein